MARFTSVQFEDDYDGYKMRTLVEDLIREFERVSADAMATIDFQEGFFEGMSTRLLIYSDFTDPPSALVTPNLHALESGVAASIAESASDPTDHPGIWQLATGTDVDGSVSILSIGNSTISGTVRAGTGRIRVGTWLQTEANLSVALQRYTIRSGLFAITSPNIIDEGIGFEYVDSQNSGRWQAICGDAAGVETSVNTGITVAADTWYKLEFEVNADGSSVEFFIDNVSVATVTTNIPSGSPFDLFYNTHIEKIIGTTSREMEIDAMYMYQEISR